EYPSSYFEELEEELLSAIRTGRTGHLLNQPGGIFVLKADTMPEEDRVLLRSASRVEFVAQRGSLSRQIARPERQDPAPTPYVPRSRYPIIDPDVEIPRKRLLFENGYGGFSQDGREYILYLQKGMATPAPWINVISNPEFGFQVSETGAGMTWSINSRENRITPWSNDWVSDPVDSAVYLRDEET